MKHKNRCFLVCQFKESASLTKLIRELTLILTALPVRMEVVFS